jgi:hypothetical protein
MYVVAQRVRSRGGSSGINAFFFLHGSMDIPGMAWASPDVDMIAARHPGTLVVQRVEQPSGGNDVLSYLDIAVHDSFGVERLARLLIGSPPPPSNTFAWTIGPVSIRFVSQSTDDPMSEFSELKKHAVLLIEPNRVGSTSSLGGRVDIIAQDKPGVGVVYRLEPGTLKRLVESRILTTDATIHVAYEDLDALKGIWGNEEFHQQIALALTGLSGDSLHRLGGYEVRHQPQPLLGPMASSRNIPGQIEGYWIGPGLPLTESPGWPTGALLRSNDGERALDLVFVEQAWFPLSEAALYTYPHTTGLQGGERWCFLCKGSTEVFEVALGPSLTRDEVQQHYGREASARSRPEHRTVQLLLRPLPR